MGCPSKLVSKTNQTKPNQIKTIKGQADWTIGLCRKWGSRTGQGVVVGSKQEPWERPDDPLAFNLGRCKRHKQDKGAPDIELVGKVGIT